MFIERPCLLIQKNSTTPATSNAAEKLLVGYAIHQPLTAIIALCADNQCAYILFCLLFLPKKSQRNASKLCTEKAKTGEIV
jgi:hypothetical protein